MCNLFYWKAKRILILSMFICFISSFTVAGQTICINEVDTHEGYIYEYWKDMGTGCMTLGPGGSFSVEWESGINNILARKGQRPGSWDNVINYEADYRPNGISYLAVYGWTTDPLVEYYIVESWGSWRPPGGSFMGTVTSDGGTYDIYRTRRINQPAMGGPATFYSFWSVRQVKRTRGTITVGNHFRAWEDLEMNMGSLYEVSFCVEGYQSSGTADVYNMSMSTAPPAPAKKLGDVNGNGNIDITDALIIARHSVGLTPPGFDVEMADTNCDGKINIIDALIIAQYSVELLSDLRACTPGLTPVGSLQSAVGTRYGWQAAARVGDIMYAAGMSRKMQIFDVSADPQFIKEIYIEDRSVGNMDIEGNNLFLSEDTSSVIYVYDITDPQNPEFRNKVDIFKLDGLAISGHYAYVCIGTKVAVYDLTNPAENFKVGEISLGSVSLMNEIYVEGDYAFIPQYNGLFILDISHPEAPLLMSRMTTIDLRDSKMALNGDYLFCNRVKQLHVINIADPSAPVLVLSENMGITASELIMTESNTMVLSYFSNLCMIDISDPLAPIIKESFELPVRGRDLFYAADILNVVYSDTSLYNNPNVPFGSAIELFDVSNSERFISLFTIDGSGVTSGIWVEPPYAYLADNREGLKIIDISDPAFPRQIGSVKTTDAKKTVIAGEIAYVADGPGGVKAINISNPAAPVLISTVLLNEVRDIEIQGSYAYVADYPEGLSIVDISNPTQLRVIYKAQSPGTTAGNPPYLNPKKIVVSGNYTYMIKNGKPELLIHDVSNPHAPLLAAEYSFSETDNYSDIGDILLKDNMAYLSSDNYGLTILDISDPANPQLWGSDNLSRGYKMDFYNDYLLGIRKSGSLFSIPEAIITNVSNPGAPFQAGGFHPGLIATDIVVNGSYIYLTCGNTTPDLLKIYKSN